MRAALLRSVLALTTTVIAQTFSDDTIDKVKANLASAAKQSWELGTRAEALLELDAPEFSVFNAKSLPPPFGSSDTGSLGDVLAIANNAVSQLPEDNTARPLDSGAGGDPPSMGIAVLLAASSGSSNTSRYQQAADNQLNFVLNSLPRNSDGAISHRVEQVQLWSDFIYMTPPFMAYYGAVKNNKTLVQMAYDQIKLYHNTLYDKKSKTWKHIALGDGVDDGHWSTGNGWAAAGALRVLATMKNSDWSGDFKNQMKDLEHWVSDILDGMYSKLDSGSLLFHNYVDDKSTFLDAASAALIASATYRLSLLRDVHHHLPDAERVRKGLVSRVDSDGWLAPVVNPDSFREEGSHSPEGQAFVLLLQSAYREWDADGRKGENAAASVMPPSRFVASLAIAVAVILALA